MALITLLAKLSPERTPKARRAHILGVISALTGELVLARAVNDAQTSEEILLSAKSTLLAEEKRRTARRAGGPNVVKSRAQTAANQKK